MESLHFKWNFVFYIDIWKDYWLAKFPLNPFPSRQYPKQNIFVLTFYFMGFTSKNNFSSFVISLWIMFKYFSHSFFRCTVTKGFAALNVLCQQKYAAIRLLCSYISLAKCLNSFCEDRLLNSKWSRGFYEAVKCVIRAFLNRLCSIVFAQHALKILHCSDVVCCILLNISLRQNIYSRTL